MPDIHLGGSFPLSVTVGALLVVLAVTIFVYRQTIPPLPSVWKFLLIALRALALALLFVLLGEPLLSVLSRRSDLPVVLFLVDDSKSMSIREATGNRIEHVRGALKRVQIDPANGLTAYARFSDRIDILEDYHPDSLAFDADATNIAASLAQVKGLDFFPSIHSVVLITDGNSTAGISPVYDAVDLGVPVFAVGVGDTSAQRDVVVRRVLTNTIAHVGSRVPVHVTVRSSGYENKRVEVILGDGTRELDRRTVTLAKGVRDYALQLSFVPETPGKHSLSVYVPPLEGELTGENNRSMVFLRALKSKINVLLIAGAPSADVAFIRRSLETDPNVQLTTRTERSGGGWYEGDLTLQYLSDAEAILLVGFPTSSTPSQTISMVRQAADGGRGIFFLLSRSVDANGLRSLEPVLPVLFSAFSSEESQMFVSLQTPHERHPIVKLSQREHLSDAWSALPPVFSLATPFVPKPSSQVLATRRLPQIAMTEPFLVISSSGNRKSLAILGYGIWRWKTFHRQTSGSGLFDEFLGSALRWLTTREDERQIRIRPTKEVFSGEEPIEFVGQVYDESYQPIDNARIMVSVQGAGRKNDFPLDPIGSGQYTGSIGALGRGEYAYGASVDVNEKKLGGDQGSFSVGGVNVEFLETRMNKPLLQQIAERTGGAYYPITELDAVTRDIASRPSFQTREVVESADTELWNRGWVAALLITLLIAEWTIRKQKGLL